MILPIGNALLLLITLAAGDVILNLVIAEVFSCRDEATGPVQDSVRLLEQIKRQVENEATSRLSHNSHESCSLDQSVKSMLPLVRSPNIQESKEAIEMRFRRLDISDAALSCTSH